MIGHNGLLKGCMVLALGLAWVLCTAAPAAERGPVAPPPAAQTILEATAVQGGLVVHLGCGDGRLTAELRAGDGYLVQGLDTDAQKLQAARKHIRSLGLYGSVSVDQFDGKRLPYVDNLVNLIVAEDLGSVATGEVMRVLCPGGVAYLKTGGQWTKTVKPRPAEIDEWTHYLHDAGNNAVSQDSVVGPPHQLQWVGGPKWARSHDHLASLSAAVSSAGRIFSIIDEGPIVAVALEPKWSLVARDAFSGVVLWKRPISRWQWHLRAFRTGPAELARRLVADRDRVYVTLDIEGPLVALDAATGQTTATYEETDGTLEVVHHQGQLFVVAGDAAGQESGQEAAAKAQRRGERPGFAEVRSQQPAYTENPPLKRLMAIDAASGRTLWKKSDADTAELMPTTLAAGGGRVFFQNADEVLCLDARSGKDVWRAPRPVSRSRPTWSAPTLVVYGDVVLSADRAVADKKTEGGDHERKVEWILSAAGGQAPVGELIALRANDGKRLWSSKCRECYNSPVDVLVADGLVWTGDVVRASDPGVVEGRDPITGEVKRTRQRDQTQFQPGMGHGRCYRNKATSEFLVYGRSGVEFIDLSSGRAVPNHWVRGGCQYGVMPCNGLLYAPPHSCACFPTAKLNGFNCLAPERKGDGGRGKAEADKEKTEQTQPHEVRLERGPAYDEQIAPPSPFPLLPSEDWPTYRHDQARSGSAGSAVPAKLQRAWQVDLGGRLSSLVIAAGKLFVAQVDAHTVHALRAEDGRRIWAYTAGGRIDSPPTIWQGRVLFGSADGWVYCLRASDGALAWRHRAAPRDLHIVSYGQIESAWPVPGSVLVRDGVVYCVAGRSSYLDGGIRLVRLDAETGRKLSETLIDHRDPDTGYQRKDTVRGTNMPGALPDVLSSDGESIYMRHTRFDLDGQTQPPEVPHLFSQAGFLDDSWWHRTYWMLGTTMGSNYGGWPQAGNQLPAGRLLVLDDSSVYGFGRNQYIHHGAHVGIDGATVFHFRPDRDGQRRHTYYQAFAITRESPGGDRQPAKAGATGRRPAVPSKDYRWTEKLPILVRAMLLAEDTLFLAGPPDVFVADDPAAALAGKRGGLLRAVSAADGKTLSQHELHSPPVFDGMAAAAGRLYLSTQNGALLCFAGQ